MPPLSRINRGSGSGLSHTMIPDAVTSPGIIMGLLYAAMILPITLVDSLLGVLVGGGILSLPSLDQSICFP